MMLDRVTRVAFCLPVTRPCSTAPRGGSAAMASLGAASRKAAERHSNNNNNKPGRARQAEQAWFPGPGFVCPLPAVRARPPPPSPLPPPDKPRTKQAPGVEKFSMGPEGSDHDARGCLAPVAINPGGGQPPPTQPRVRDSRVQKSAGSSSSKAVGAMVLDHGRRHIPPTTMRPPSDNYRPRPEPPGRPWQPAYGYAAAPSASAAGDAAAASQGGRHHHQQLGRPGAVPGPVSLPSISTFDNVPYRQAASSSSSTLANAPYPRPPPPPPPTTQHYMAPLPHVPIEFSMAPDPRDQSNRSNKKVCEVICWGDTGGREAASCNVKGGGFNGREPDGADLFFSMGHLQEIKRRTKTGCLTCRKRRIKVSSHRHRFLPSLPLSLNLGASVVASGQFLHLLLQWHAVRWRLVCSAPAAPAAPAPS